MLSFTRAPIDRDFTEVTVSYVFDVTTATPFAAAKGVAVIGARREKKHNLKTFFSLLVGFLRESAYIITEGVKSMTDREILNYIKSDNRKGMEYIIDCYSAFVYKIVSSVILPVGTVQDVEECVSDAFVIFYNNIHKIDLEKASLKGFLAMIAKRNAISHYRILKRNVYNEENYKNESEIPQTEPFVDSDTKQMIFDAVKALGETDTTIVVSRYVLGETAKEISVKTGLSAEAVQKRLERSLRKLREMLGGVMDE